MKNDDVSHLREIHKTPQPVCGHIIRIMISWCVREDLQNGIYNHKVSGRGSCESESNSRLIQLPAKGAARGDRPNINCPWTTCDTEVGREVYGIDIASRMRNVDRSYFLKDLLRLPDDISISPSATDVYLGLASLGELVTL